MAYVLLAQKLLRHDRAVGMLWLGINAEVADFILGLSSAQIIRMSTTNALLCSFRFSGSMPAVFESVHEGHVQQSHLFIVLASHQNQTRPPEPQEEIPA